MLNRPFFLFMLCLMTMGNTFWYLGNKTRGVSEERSGVQEVEVLPRAVSASEEHHGVRQAPRRAVAPGEEKSDEGPRRQHERALCSRPEDLSRIADIRPFRQGADGSAAAPQVPIPEPDLFKNPMAEPLEIPPKAPPGGISEIVFERGDAVAARIPPDHGARLWVHVRNRSARHIALSFNVYCLETGQHLLAWPQPNMLFLPPGERQGIFTFLDSLWGRLDKLPRGRAARTLRFDFAVAARADGPFTCSPASYGRTPDRMKPEASFTKSCDFIVTAWEKMPRPVILTGTVRSEGAGAPVPGARVSALWGNESRLSALTDGEGRYTLGLPHEGEWIVRVHSVGCHTAYACTERSSRPRQNFVLRSRSCGVAFTRERYACEPPGFWKGASSLKKDRVLLIQGMEHWVDEGWKSSSSLVMTDLGGKVLWKYAMGWEGWGCDVSPDGRYSACVTMCRPSPEKPSSLTLLDNLTGRPLWVRETSQLYDSRPMDSREVAIAPGNRLIALGTFMGDLLILDRESGAVKWSAFCGGQVRRLRFVDGGRHLLAGCGDGNLYRFESSTGRLLWKTFVRGWAFTDGIDVSSRDGRVAVGTKTGYLSVLDGAKGRIAWTVDMGGPVHYVRFSPRGDLLLAGSDGEKGTRVFRAATGLTSWQAGFSQAGEWLGKGERLVIADRLVAVYDKDGTLLAVPTGLHGRAHFACSSPDGDRIIVATSRGEIAAFRGGTAPRKSDDEEWDYP